MRLSRTSISLFPVVETLVRKGRGFKWAMVGFQSASISLRSCVALRTHLRSGAGALLALMSQARVRQGREIWLSAARALASRSCASLLADFQ